MLEGVVFGGRDEAGDVLGQKFLWNDYMLFFTGKQLIALALALQVFTLEPSLAYLQSSDSAKKTQRATVAAGAIEMRTDTEGVDFAPFMKSLYLSIKRQWFAGMPPSVEKGEKGVVQIQFRVLRDGKVPEDSLKVVFSSEKRDLDEASLQAVRNSAPFDHLPEKYSQPFIELRMGFYYNVAPPRAQ